MCVYINASGQGKEIAGQVTLLATSVLKEIIIFDISISFLDT